MSYQIRLAKRDEKEAILTVGEKTWLATYPSQEYGITAETIREKYQEIRQKGLEPVKQTGISHYWVATIGGEIVGFCLAKRDKDKGLIGALYVLPEHQGKKIGSKLLAQAIKWFGHREKVITEVVIYNTKAIFFYEKYGFIKIGKTEILQKRKMPNGAIMPITKMVLNI